MAVTHQGTGKLGPIEYLLLAREAGKVVVIRENHYDWDRGERVESLKFGGFFTLYTDTAHGLKSPKLTSMECWLKMDSLDCYVGNPQLEKLRDLSLRLGLSSGLRTFAKHLEEEVDDLWL